MKKLILLLILPMVFMMNGQNISQFANDGATLDNLAGDRIPDMKDTIEIIVAIR